MKEKKARVEDALHATRAAVEEGIVAGGGVALLRAKKAIEEAQGRQPDQDAGIKIVLRAIEEPLRRSSPTPATSRGRRQQGPSKARATTATTPQTGEYGDMIEMGILDPTKVTRLALQNAASVARPDADDRGMVAESPKEESGTWRRHGGGGMGGMGGMVHVFARNRADGVQDWNYIVDARTGAVLRADSGLRNVLPPVNPPTQRPTDTAAVGIGHSQYSGDVALDTTMHADGTFALVDRTRGSQYNPYLHDGYYDIFGNQIFDADGNPIHAIGLQTLTETHEGFNFTWAADNWWFDNHANDEWGDGTQFVMFPYGGETGTNGETAAVDAHYGMATTWDFYRNVFNRDGIDNQGTSAISVVHVVNQFGYYYDNAFWNDYVFGMFYSDGTRNAGVDPNTGDATLPNPNGFTTLTALDVIGHEMTHGVTATTAALIYDGESGGLNESTSDILGKMVETYRSRPPGTDTLIPLAGTNWLLGHDLIPGGLRSMFQPSSDGLSSDNWYAGIQFLDVHFSSGPLNRFYYYLCDGAPSSVVDTAHSKYLPDGMTGIGNDHAARIWYKALTEYLAPDADYAAARVAAVSAATDLYGAGSPEVQAVKNAFAAINVGTPTDAPRVYINMPLVHPDGTALNPYGGGFFARMPVVSMNTTVQLTADVENTTDTAVTWQLGGAPGGFANPGFRNIGGIVTPDGHWTPNSEWGFHAMTVVSHADPLEYAEGTVWVVNGDADADTQFDAMDLGAVALSWGLDGYINASHAVGGDGFVDSLDVAVIVEAFRNAYGGK
jgi:hypothetical protein